MAAFIFFMSARSAGELSASFLGQLKSQLNAVVNGVLGTSGDPMSTVAHFCEYLVFGALLVNALRSHMPLGRAAAVAIACASAYGVSDEIHQIFVKGRYCDVADWATDTLGACLGALCAWRVLRNRLKRHYGQPPASG
ncbi:MAG: VanZ family protein [Eggerthellaceae bacterium]|nr:VanZ family protein [Eggerthellaceae bacterium]